MGKKADRDKIAELYQKGSSVERIASAEGLSEYTIRRALRAKGIAIRRDLDTGKIVALAGAGWRPADIAWDIGASEKEVLDVLRRRRKEAGHA